MEKNNILSGVIATVNIPPTTEKFVAKDKFVVSTKVEAKVKISHLSGDFESWFIGKIEEPFSGSTVYGYKLNKSSIDYLILSELGDQEKAETTLAEIYTMMERQANGKSGDLLNDGHANIFYVSNITGALRAVIVAWDGDGWGVDADFVNLSLEWCSDSQVFSRNPLLPAPQSV